jgi:outer membrane protein assembly factor BamB
MTDPSIAGPGTPTARRGAAVAAMTAVLVLALGTATPSLAAVTTTARIALSKAVGPPTTRITVKGQGFGPTEVVDLSFDSQPNRKATTDPSGRLSSPLRVPASALPGDHVVSATGETSGLSASAPFTVRTDWPMFKFGPDHVGVNPYENVLSPQNVSGLQVAWALTATKSVDSSPAVAGGRVFVGADDSLYAADAATGAGLWTWTDPLTTYVASPALWHGRVYFGTDRGSLYALDAATGAQDWSYPTGGSIAAPPALAGGVVYVGSGNGLVLALDAVTGQKLWSTCVGSPVFGGPAVAGGVVYAGSEFVRKLYALDAATGAILWTGNTGGYIFSSPAVANGLVYIGSDDNKLYAFPAPGCGQATCSPVWTFAAGSWVESSPAVAYGMVYVGSDDNNVYALDAATGALEWTVPTGDAISLGSPAVANGVVYIGSNDHVLRAIDARSGEVLWTYTMGNLVGWGAAVADGWVYVGSFDKNLYAFHLPG